MRNKAGTEYKLGVLWQELNASTADRRIRLHNKPHVERWLNSNAARFLMTHVQNFTWTVERLLPKRPAPRSLYMPGERAPHLAPSRAASVVEGKERILLDVTGTVRSTLRTGIQRVCRRICEEGMRDNALSPVAIERGVLHFLSEDGGLGAPVGEFRRDDIYVVFDTFWEPIDDYVSMAKAAHSRGALVATCFYDVIPAIDPEICQVGFERLFKDTMRKILPHTDIVIGISRVTLNDIQDVCRRLGVANPPAQSFFHLGADLIEASKDVPPPPEAVTVRPFFLSVGTLEPKKGYALTLDAFDRLWSEGHEINLVIVGKYGWSAEATRARIKSHPKLGTHLFWFDAASDERLQSLYASAYCFLQASVAEGFGIPLVEAGLHELPIIASDIAVFQEVAEKADVVFFRSEDADALHDAVLSTLRTRPQPRPWQVGTWRDSMLDLVSGLKAAARTVRASAARGAVASAR